MPATRQISITLPEALANRLAEKIASGEFIDESAAVQCGLTDLFADDDRSGPNRLSFEEWLQQEVVPAYDQLQANPESGLSIEEVRASLDRRRAHAHSTR